MSLRKNTIYLLLSNVLQLAYTVALTIVLARLIEDKNAFGKLQQVILFSAIISNIFSSFGNSLNYFSGYYQLVYEKIGEFTNRFFRSGLLISFVVFFFFLFFGTYLGEFFENDLFIISYFVIAILFFLRTINSLLPNACLVKSRLTWLIIVNLIQIVLSFIILYTLYRFKLLNSYNVILLLTAMELLKFLSLVLISPPWKHFNIIDLKKNFIDGFEFKYVLVLMGSTIVSTIAAQSDKLIISSLANPSLFSDYSVGTFANPFVSILSGSTMAALIPIISSHYTSQNISEITNIWKSASSKICLMLLPLVLFTIFFGREIILMLFSEKFATSAVLFQIFNLKFLFTFIVFNSTMNAIGLAKKALVGSLINLAAVSIFTYYGYQYFGLLGAVIGVTIVGCLIGYIYPIWVVNKQLKVGLKDYFPLKIFFITTFISCGLLIMLKLIGIAWFEDSKYFVVGVAPFFYGIVLIASNKVTGNTLRLISLPKFLQHS